MVRGMRIDLIRARSTRLGGGARLLLPLVPVGRVRGDRIERGRHVSDVDGENVGRVLSREGDVQLEILLARIADEDEPTSASLLGSAPLSSGSATTMDNAPRCRELFEDPLDVGLFALARFFPQLGQRATRASILLEGTAPVREPGELEERAQDGPQLDRRVRDVVELGAVRLQRTVPGGHARDADLAEFADKDVPEDGFGPFRHFSPLYRVFGNEM